MERSDRINTNVVRVKNQIFRVIDDGDRVITTSDPYVALVLLSRLIEKHDVTACWVDIEEVK